MKLKFIGLLDYNNSHEYDIIYELSEGSNLVILWSKNNTISKFLAYKPPVKFPEIFYETFTE